MNHSLWPHRLLCRGAGASLALALLVGCSGSDNTTITSPTPAPTTPTVSTSPTLLNGSFVYTASGTNGVDGDYQVAGQFVADGKGNITSAIADYNLGGGVDTAVTMYGTYTVSGSTVTVLLTDGGSASEAYIVSYASSGTSTFSNNDGTGTGTLYPQTTTGTTLAGTYTYSLKGEGEGPVTTSGTFKTAANGMFTGGSATYTDAGVTQTYAANTGFVGVPQSNGRGLATVGGNNFSYYIISPTQLVFMGRDDRALLQGLVTKS